MMIENQIRRPTFTFWLGANWLFLWILASALGGAIAYPLLIVIGIGAVNAQIGAMQQVITMLAAPLAGVVGGATSGLVQWLVLRRNLPGSHSWTLRAMLAWASGFFVTAGLFFWLAVEGLDYVTLVVPFIGGGAVAGFFHAPLIRRWVRGVGWWVLAMASGWVLGWVAGWAFLAQFLLSPAIPERGLIIILGAIHGAFIGFQSGLTLIYLLIFVPQQEPSPAEQLPEPLP